MEEEGKVSIGVGSEPVEDPPLVTEDLQVPAVDAPKTDEAKTESEALEPACDNNESGIVVDTSDDKTEVKPTTNGEPDACEVQEDARSLDLDSLPAVDELVLGAAGSDSGVEGCGRALSSGGGSRSCASSVVSCGSGCGSESSSVAGAPPRPRRHVNVSLTEPLKRIPMGASTPRPATAPRGPNLATRERARSREKPVPPEKPRPLTPKPRIRPTASELPNLVRESPALRAKPTKTSAARCRTPNSPGEEKRWPTTNGPRLSNVMDTSATRVTADKYGTLPRRRRDDNDCSPKHDITPPSSRRPTITRSTSSRSATKTRVRIYAEKTAQTVLLGADIEAALGGLQPNIDSRVEVTKCHRGVQASARDSETSRLAAAVARAEAACDEERTRRLRAEAMLADERAARLAAHRELERNTKRLLELAGDGAGAGAEGCLHALEEQLRAAGELATRQRTEVDTLREHCEKLHAEACSSREAARALEARLGEAEREAAEMQDFLAAETGALGDSLREAEAELARANHDLERRRAECRQLVRMCEQRRQEALAAAARARSGGGGGGAARALDALGRRLRALTAAVARAYRLPPDRLEPAVFHNDAFSRSDSGDALTPEDEAPRGGLLACVARALRAAPALAANMASSVANSVANHATPADDDRSRASDDNSAELLDSETEPCLVTDPEYQEEWWSGAEGAGGWSGDELSPVRDEPASAASDSLRNLSAAIANRQRSEAEDTERGSLLDRVLAIDNRLTELLHALRLAAAAAAHTDDADSMRLANALRDKIDVTERNVADVVVKKLQELDASKSMMDQYRHSVEMLKIQLAQFGNEESLELLEEEVLSCSENERRERYEALDAALVALSSRQRTVCAWGRLATLQSTLERLAFALAAAPAPAPAPAPPAAPLQVPA